MYARIDELHSRIDGLRAEMMDKMERMRAEVMGEMEKLRAEMHRNFRYLLTIIISVLFPMWVTIILTILFKR